MIDIEFSIKKKEKNFTVIDNGIFKDKQLSLKGKGMLCTLLSLPSTWKITIEGLASLSNDGNSAVKSALAELHDAGYLAKRRLHKDGKIVGWRYIIFEERQIEYDETDIMLSTKVENQLLDNIQEVENQVTCKQSTCNLQLLNTNNINNIKDKERVYSSEAADTAKTITEYSVHDKEEVSVKPKPKFKMSAPEQVFESEYQFGNTKPRKSNLHEKCIAYVYEWTNDDNTRKLLIQYLGLCFEMGSIRGINQWKGMLDNTLVKCQQKSEPHTYDDLIQLAIDYGWKTFHEWKEYGGKTKQYKSSISDADYRSNRRVTAEDKAWGREF